MILTLKSFWYCDNTILQRKQDSHSIEIKKRNAEDLGDIWELKNARDYEVIYWPRIRV